MLPSRIFFDEMLDDLEKIDYLKCDVYEKDDKYFIEVDVPGYNKDDIKLEFNKGNLIIAVQKKDEEDDDKKYLHRERKRYSKITRTVYLGDIDDKNIAASFDRGILKISVPKQKENDYNRFIEIE